MRVAPAELRFPIGDPFFDGELKIARRAEEMQVIRHKHVRTNQPGIGILPGGNKGLLSFLGGQPGRRTSSAHGQKDYGWVTFDEHHAFGRIPPAGILWESHGENSKRSNKRLKEKNRAGGAGSTRAPN